MNFIKYFLIGAIISFVAFLIPNRRFKIRDVLILALTASGALFIIDVCSNKSEFFEGDQSTDETATDTSILGGLFGATEKAENNQPPVLKTNVTIQATDANIGNGQNDQPVTEQPVVNVTNQVTEKVVNDQPPSNGANGQVVNGQQIVETETVEVQPKQFDPTLVKKYAKNVGVDQIPLESCPATPGEVGSAYIRKYGPHIIGHRNDLTSKQKKDFIYKFMKLHLLIHQQLSSNEKISKDYIRDWNDSQFISHQLKLCENQKDEYPSFFRHFIK